MKYDVKNPVLLSYIRIQRIKLILCCCYFLDSDFEEISHFFHSAQ